MRKALFGPSDRRMLRQAARQAEDLTSHFYCIPGREWPRFPYEVCTLADGTGPEVPVFADVVRWIRPPSPRQGLDAAERFRIRLRDDEILSVARERRHGVELHPLLLYVMTHELVHVVRFGSGMAEFETDDPEARSAEEARVHGLTSAILKPVACRAVRRVSDLYLSRIEAG